MHRIFIMLIAFFSCSLPTSRQQNSKILDFGVFTIETPKGWKKVNVAAVDSYIGSIAIDGHDTLEFGMGWYSNNLKEMEPDILNRSFIKINPQIDTTQIIIVDDRTKVDPDRYKLNNVRWDTVGGYEAKIVFPRRTGKGTTGIYIDSLWASGYEPVKFNLYGVNMLPANEKTFLEALKTLKFHQPNKERRASK